MIEAESDSMAAHQVLVVEDNTDVRETLMELLESHGYQALGAEHGQEALDKIQNLPEPPCMIVLDLMMPVMDGRAFRQEQLKDPKMSQIPVVVVSAYDSIPYRKELDASAYLRKPLDLRELLRLVDRYC